MNMKQISALMVGMLFTSTAWAEEAAEPFEPNFSEMTGISWGSPAALFRWWGIFLADGSANLYRSGGDIQYWFLQAPEGSFSFEEIYKLVAPHLKRNYDNANETLSIAFSYGYYPDTVVKRFYIEDKTAMRTLMHGLRDKALSRNDNDRAYWEGLISVSPLVPGDPRAPFLYDKNADRIAQRNAFEKVKVFEREDIIMRRAIQGRTLSSPEEEERAVEAELAKWEAEIGFTDTAKGDNTDKPSTNRPWLYVAIFSILCAGAVIWFIRKRR